uniref:Tyrosine specific protein phosphatases domain-containing protein n=1 Tax=Cyprinus carpio TaxID=7962 RepID=A0A8C2AT98_CYPCA
DIRWPAMELQRPALLGFSCCETPSVKELEKILFGGKRSGNHVDEVWPNLFLGDMSVANDRFSVWKLGITRVLNARVLVHCAVGVSRSASLVLAYLMIHQHLSLLEAIKTVKEHRWIFPNRGFLKQLRALDATLPRFIDLFIN